jgi:cytochrome c-type biogenesis protein CcmH/NrfG
MKKKIVLETPEQLSARKEKERRELARWEREQQRPKTKGYIWYTMAILAMIYAIVTTLLFDFGG